MSETTEAGPIPNSQWPVMVAVIMTMLATMGAVVAVIYRGGDQSTPVIVTVLGFAATLTGTLLALVKVQQVANQAAELHVLVNHRLTELVASTQAAATAEGREAGGDKARAEGADVLAALAAMQAQIAALQERGQR